MFETGRGNPHILATLLTLQMAAVKTTTAARGNANIEIVVFYLGS